MWCPHQFFNSVFNTFLPPCRENRILSDILFIIEGTPCLYFVILDILFLFLSETKSRPYQTIIFLWYMFFPLTSKALLISHLYYLICFETKLKYLEFYIHQKNYCSYRMLWRFVVTIGWSINVGMHCKWECP